jgi:hypothetical protein
MKRFRRCFQPKRLSSQVPSWRKVGRQIHEAPSAPLQFVSLMKSPVFHFAAVLYGLSAARSHSTAGSPVMKGPMR